MKIVSFRGREDKMHLVAHLFRDYLQGYVLDMGCDQRVLGQFVKLNGRYVGADIAGYPDVRVNFEFGLPFSERSFDCVLACDVLEHLEAIHFVFDEMCRVSRRFLIICLPNVYEWHFRVRFLLGKCISEKYGLPAEPPGDRHRWLFSLEEAKRFVSYRARMNRFQVREEVLGFYRYHRLIPRILTGFGKLLASKAGASFFAYHWWVVLERELPQEAS